MGHANARISSKRIVRLIQRCRRRVDWKGGAIETQRNAMVDFQRNTSTLDIGVPSIVWFVIHYCGYDILLHLALLALSLPHIVSKAFKILVDQSLKLIGILGG